MRKAAYKLIQNCEKNNNGIIVYKMFDRELEISVESP